MKLDPSGSDTYIAIGEILGAHGIDGAVRVRPLTDFPERFDDLREVLLSGPLLFRRVRISDCRRQQDAIVLFLEGVDSRAESERLAGHFIKVPRAEVHPLPPGRFYDFDLIGLSVVTVEGRFLGKVKEILHTGANDVFVVEPVLEPIDRPSDEPAGGGEGVVTGFPAGDVPSVAVPELSRGETGTPPPGTRGKPGKRSRKESRPRELLIPAVREMIREIDLQGGLLVVDPWKGLL